MAATRRLQQTLSHIQPPKPVEQLSVVYGPTQPPLLDITLGELLALQSLQYGEHECLVFPWTGTRWTYSALNEEADRLAQGLLAMGIHKGDRIGIMAGNCEQYISVFFAAARVGAILVVLNNTYTPSELYYALEHTDCRLLFMTPRIGRHNLEEVLSKMGPHPKRKGSSAALEEIVILRGEHSNFSTYSSVIERGLSVSSNALLDRQAQLRSDDVCNLQFTSGSTGNPKAAMLTHQYQSGQQLPLYRRQNGPHFLRYPLLPSTPVPLLRTRSWNVSCCHTWSEDRLPQRNIDPKSVLHAISDEKCTALHGVPTMFEAILSLPKPPNFDTHNLRTGIIAGAPVPRPLMKRLFEELNMTQYTSSYGLTEASPTCFNAVTTDTIETRLRTVGRVMPHAKAKIIDAEGRIVPVGQRGELCIAGYQLTKGYWNNPDKTAETLTTDADGTTWLKTGDEAIFDPQGRCTITGRFKDIIIRGTFATFCKTPPYITVAVMTDPIRLYKTGGENIYPLEIEERLASHPAIEVASVIGIPDHKYGEVVGAFIALAPGYEDKRPSDEELRVWTREKLGRHKAPQYVFVFGEEGVDRTIPITGSGKVRKVDLRKTAAQVLERRTKAN
ncbi:long-chain-fatty-acid-CoA ligase [Aspergillus arachidicola]|uniref:Long-chain-fatty-acid-CoA ligase n=1 Tax=Aspergillus arachidicola TaxID=656916 RepID=A0A2G7FQU0_9EURO|nr:long-chain-fatty-acid-CoA ligase [Aspergillus arachidicola]